MLTNITMSLDAGSFVKGSADVRARDHPITVADSVDAMAGPPKPIFDTVDFALSVPSAHVLN